LTSKSLYTMVESIAEKEIQKDPIEFIRRESFQVGNEEFYSVDSDNQYLDPIPEPIKEVAEEEDDDDENEYHD
jgi:hypothetical protein